MSKFLLKVRPLARATAIAATVCGVLHTPAALAAEVTVQRVWQYAHQGEQKAEIVAYDDRTDTLWVAGVVGVDILDRATGQFVAHISVTNLGAVNSVAIHDGLAALALERATTSAFGVFDITNPADMKYIDMIVSDGDRSPEGLAAFKVGDRYYVAIAHEVSDTSSLFEIDLFKGRGAKR